MPVTYTLAPARKRILTRCFGNATFDEVLGHFDTLANDPSCPDRLDVLLDMTELTSIPETDQLWAITKKIEDVLFRVRFDRCAIVADRDVVFGMTRMFEAIAEGHFSAVRA